MAKYYFDCEFSERFKKPISWLPSIGNFNKRYHSIELISIGICCDDGREYYAVSKDFDLTAAWNKWQPRTGQGGRNDSEPKEYWLRENVLLPVFYEAAFNDFHSTHIKDEWKYLGIPVTQKVFKNLPKRWHDVSWFRKLLSKYGKSNKQIADEILNFVYAFNYTTGSYTTAALVTNMQRQQPIEFFGYFCDYDWVLFATLFGTMNDLPAYFPNYCRDLKQTLDEKVAILNNSPAYSFGIWTLENMQQQSAYPQNHNEHHALSDARWAMNLDKFLSALK